MQKPPQNISRGNPHDCLIRSRKKVFDKFNSCSFKNNTVSTLGKGNILNLIQGIYLKRITNNGENDKNEKFFTLPKCRPVHKLSLSLQLSFLNQFQA